MITPILSDSFNLYAMNLMSHQNNWQIKFISEASFYCNKNSLSCTHEAFAYSGNDSNSSFNVP